MQSNHDDSHVLLLYYVPFTNEVKAKEDIIAALKNFVVLQPDAIQITSKEEKHSAYISVPESQAKAIESIRSIKIGDTEANIRRYYFDYQIYINKLPLAINQMDVSKYFSKFGEVTNVALTTSATDKNPEPSNHCFVKFKSDESVKKCFLMRRHQIMAIDFRIFRTYKIGESENTDKKLFFKVDPSPENLEAFQNQVNDIFQSYGSLRDRVRFEGGKTSNIATITFTSNEGAENALKNFDKNILKKDKNSQLNIELKVYSLNKEEQSLNKVFAKGIHPNTEEETLRKAFENYGVITDFIVSLAKTGQNFINAIVTYAKNEEAKTLLAQYLEDKELSKLFYGKPSIEFYLNPGDKKNYKSFVNKSKNPSSKLTTSNQPIYLQQGGYPYSNSMGFAPSSNQYVSHNFNFPKYGNPPMASYPGNNQPHNFGNNFQTSPPYGQFGVNK